MSTPEDIPAPPQKTSWKGWTLALACVLSTAVVIYVLVPPATEPVMVAFLHATNYNGNKRLVFQLTNGTARAIYYNAYTTTNLTASSHPLSPPVIYKGAASALNIAPGGTVTFSLPAPPREPAWRIVWWFGDLRRMTPWDERRLRFSVFLWHHGMESLAGRIQPANRKHYISPADLNE